MYCHLRKEKEITFGRSLLHCIKGCLICRTIGVLEAFNFVSANGILFELTLFESTNPNPFLSGGMFML